MKGWSKFTGAKPIDADTFLDRAVQQQNFDDLQEGRREARRPPCDCTVMADGLDVCRYCREREAGK